MASNIKGITVEISGNTQPLEKSLQGVNTKLHDTQYQLRETNKLLKLDPTNTELLQEKQELLSRAIQDTTTKLKTLNKAKEQFGDYSKLTDNEKDKYNALTREITKCEQQQKGFNDQLEKMNSSFGNATNSALTFGDVLEANIISDTVMAGLGLLADKFKELADAVSEWADNYQDLEVYEKQFENNIKNTTKATNSEIKALKDLAKQKSQYGVISDKSIMSAYQELATYVESTDAIKGLTNALVDMSAQQYGVDATEQSVRNIATTLGKALANGDYSGLTRLGYGFDEVQQKIMETGTELERVSVIADVVGSSIGGMNEALLQTDQGKIFNITQSFGDLEKNIGSIVSAFKVDALQKVGEWFESEDVKERFESIENLSEDIANMGASIDLITPSLDLLLGMGERALDNAKDLLGTITAIMDCFEPDAVNKIVGVIETYINYASMLKEVLQGIFITLSYILNKRDNLGSLKDALNGSTSSYGFGDSKLNSNGFSNSITLNNSFNVSGGLNEETAKQFANMMADEINERLGVLV